ncbi:MAG TPA: ATP-binding protein [Solirubrobacteraceae bacterium]|nr:ATP-binding protein [Solirubrobacteraceae bacterium]
MSAPEPQGSRVARQLRRMGVGQLLAVTIGLVLVLAVVGIGLALGANGQLTHNRHLLLDQVGPARRTALSLENALVNEETGVRGFALTSEASFLEPYDSGLRAERRAYQELEALGRVVGAPIPGDVARVRSSADAWRGGYVAPTLIEPHSSKAQAIMADRAGKRLFDGVRSSLATLERELDIKDADARDRLEDAAGSLQTLLIVAAVLILGGVLAAGLLLRGAVTRPLARLGREARRVAGGEFSTPLTIAGGPREITEVGDEIDAMRQRIVDELATVERARGQLEEQALELTRSNAELEQFAYVASHDLQEPLRKIASFCQALKTRYGDQLDERGEQYIEFAVDGAKRMQILINDLLTFSRVGRGGREQEMVDLNEVLSGVETALAAPIERTGASVSATALPSIRGDRTQLASLFQNLISNALKFRGSEPPLVRIAARRVGAFWELSATDNGIGVEQEYAERIFLIFQRLHSRESFEGSGIGLALCRKIVEFHGGHMWLDSEFSNGARFRFTLPVDEGANDEAGTEGTSVLEMSEGTR